VSNHNTVIQTINLSVGYKERGRELCLFENINISLKAGELVCFMGPNGAGKSTMIRTLAGLQPPLNGNVEIQQSVAMVLTDKITATHMTVAELVSFGRYPYLDWRLSLLERDHTIMNEAISTVRIESLMNKRLFELSDGQLQMVMIAKALAQDTSILLLDEPTAHLDLNNRVEIMNMLREFSRSQGKAILVATHELDLALQTADLIWLVTNDQKIKQGIPEDLVLDGSFDQVFQFKGFDLKTGKVSHHPFRNLTVSLSGTGHEFLWTKNALERSGYNVKTASIEPVSVEIYEGQKAIWKLTKHNVQYECNTLAELFGHLNRKDD